VTGHRRNSVTGKGFCERRLAGLHPGALNDCAPCRRYWQEAEVVRQTHALPHIQATARTWGEHALDVFDDRACMLRPGDAYTFSGCSQTHFVVAVADRTRESHTDLLLYLPGEERITDVRVRRDRLLAVQRPHPEATAVNPESRLVP
jgi:hypothetical protein